MSWFDEKLSICVFSPNLHCFFFFNNIKSKHFFIFLYAIKFFLSNVNLYNLHFLYSHFSSQLNKRIFYDSTFPPPNNHYGGKLKSIPSLTFSSHSPFSISPLFHFPNQTKPKSNHISLCKIQKSSKFYTFYPKNFSHQSNRSCLNIHCCYSNCVYLHD